MAYSNRNNARSSLSAWINPRRSSVAKATSPSSAPPTAPP
ncbi:putative uncharacterized protein [Corynebacterium casei UCMA 3821]|uniref:Uncharacterized protein n=1 Tax=Corynebacterium casei UCMA 3821 TaxID=1110505 RepID=G7HVN9_9CORY|nr:putative uncharacterized protein [Corynebacterium casei UCMA 3821]